MHIFKHGAGLDHVTTVQGQKVKDTRRCNVPATESGIRMDGRIATSNLVEIIIVRRNIIQFLGHSIVQTARK